jgi:hypothetical protein
MWFGCLLRSLGNLDDLFCTQLRMPLPFRCGRLKRVAKAELTRHLKYRPPNGAISSVVMAAQVLRAETAARVYMRALAAAWVAAEPTA